MGAKSGKVFHKSARFTGEYLEKSSLHEGWVVGGEGCFLDKDKEKEILHYYLNGSW